MNQRKHYRATWNPWSCALGFRKYPLTLDMYLISFKPNTQYSSRSSFSSLCTVYKGSTRTKSSFQVGSAQTLGSWCYTNYLKFLIYMEHKGAMSLMILLVAICPVSLSVENATGSNTSTIMFLSCLVHHQRALFPAGFHSFSLLQRCLQAFYTSS